MLLQSHHQDNHTSAHHPCGTMYNSSAQRVRTVLQILHSRELSSALLLLQLCLLVPCEWCSIARGRRTRFWNQYAWSNFHPGVHTQHQLHQAGGTVWT